MYSDYELYKILEENHYKTSEKNLSILKEGLENGKYVIEESYSDEYLMEVLKENKYKANEKNLSILKEGLESGKYVLNEFLWFGTNANKTAKDMNKNNAKNSKNITDPEKMEEFIAAAKKQGESIITPKKLKYLGSPKSVQDRYDREQAAKAAANEATQAKKEARRRKSAAANNAKAAKNDEKTAEIRRRIMLADAEAAAKARELGYTPPEKKPEDQGK